MFSKKFRNHSTDQLLLLPPDVREWLPKNHLAYFVSDLVDNLDLSEFIKAYKNTAEGKPPFHPAMMLKILVYGYSTGICSSRQLMRKIDEDIAFKFLAAGDRPDFRTIALFRKKHLSALRKLFLQVLKLAKEAGLVKIGVIAIDGTKMKANASRHKALSYGRMDEVESRLKRRIDDILKEAGDIDISEDELYGEDKRGDELPEELADPVKRIKKIRELKKKIEEEEKAKTNNTGATPKDKEQRSLTDYDARIMKMPNKSFDYAYNGQAAVCGDPRKGEVQIIVATKLTNRPCDVTELEDMLRIAEENLGEHPKKLVADAGYYSKDNLKYCQNRKIDAYIPPNRQKHTELGEPSPKGRIPAHATQAFLMRRKLKTKKGKEIYGARKVMNEPVFGQQKQARGIRQFLLRGLNNVAAEWDFICATGNILKLFRYGNLPQIGWGKS
ncbi:MAG: IS5/IS1182 family transposase [Candidatus Aquicultor secundus]|uniref:IS5/IS1182 family transposase n=1 Tax=Candidatus Aquicultor secundus TaxID=1973895 RepID=A0A2M7T7V4_9ACTN|nr:IS1182 family transposase [Candidatus Aquicultor secundus]PIW21593.1 MAG: IS5/IS1182 family transposase [Candidatus Aquicultor secundus]PIZ38579.1 MAG: IS5/IS1182 family transposase [Candidatus Aquicultor secundus]